YTHIVFFVLLSFPTRRSSDLVHANLFPFGRFALLLLGFGHFLIADARIERDQPALRLRLAGSRYRMRPSSVSDSAIRRHRKRIGDRKSTRLNSSHVAISYAVF